MRVLATSGNPDRLPFVAIVEEDEQFKGTALYIKTARWHGATKIETNTPVTFDQLLHLGHAILDAMTQAH